MYAVTEAGLLYLQRECGLTILPARMSAITSASIRLTSAADLGGDGFRWLVEGVLTSQTSAAPNSTVFSGFAWKRQRPPSVAQAVQASRFFFVPLHRFLVARDGSSFRGDTPSVDASALLWRSMFEGELGVARFVGFDDEHDDSG